MADARYLLWYPKCMIAVCMPRTPPSFPSWLEQCLNLPKTRIQQRVSQLCKANKTLKPYTTYIRAFGSKNVQGLHALRNYELDDKTDIALALLAPHLSTDILLALCSDTLCFMALRLGMAQTFS